MDLTEPIRWDVSLPRIGITMGDPGGIGPEVVVRALADEGLRGRVQFVVFGVSGALAAAAERAEVAWPPAGVELEMLPGGVGDFAPVPSAEGGAVSFECVRRAIEWAKLPEGDPRRLEGVVTCPISKEAWAMAGHFYPGHTELFAESFGVDDYAMMFYAPPSQGRPSLNVILVTTHLPLAQVATAVTPDRVRRAVRLGEAAMRRLGHARARIAVCGLNPHAGENGLLGTEDRDVIAPVVEELRREGLDVHGPLPGDTVFARALLGPGLKPEFDLVVAMYHDQGLAPVKLIARDRTVNMTVGLPVVRTSPDHGTAFDIAGKGVADAGSMRAAIELAVRLAEKS
jgi:4-hydroxythreonine-4-phosphate dehydrogenase